MSCPSTLHHSITDIQTEIQTEKRQSHTNRHRQQADRERFGKTDSQTGILRQRGILQQADTETGRQTRRQTGRYVDKQADTETGRQTRRQAGRHGNRQKARLADTEFVFLYQWCFVWFVWVELCSTCV